MRFITTGTVNIDALNETLIRLDQLDTDCIAMDRHEVLPKLAVILDDMLATVQNYATDDDTPSVDQLRGLLRAIAEDLKH